MQNVTAIAIFIAVCYLNPQAQNQAPTPGQGTTSAAAPSGTPTVPPSVMSTPQTSPQTQVPDSTETAEALARKYLELWNTGDVAAINSFPDFIMHSHGGRVVVGGGMLGRVITAWRKSMPDLIFTIDDTVAEGDKVVLRVTLKGTYKELLFPEASDPPSPPRPIRSTGLLMFKIKDSRLLEIWQELDDSAMRVQMGAQWKTRQERAAEAAAQSKKQEKVPTGTAPPKR